jgi:NADPH-dependent 2,4-dienoyl-CoA reductase/sulfur reductase-like enzyme
VHLVVVGGVAAGLAAASRARRLDAEIEITVLEKGDVVSYAACGLPYLIENRIRQPEQLVLHKPDFFLRERDIRVETGAEVVEIQPQRQTVRLQSGKTLNWDRLILATGARPVHQWPEHPRLFALNTLGDAVRLHKHLAQTPPGRAAILGAGYIALETADALRHRQWRVTLHHRSADLLHRHDKELTRRLDRILNAHHIDIVHNHEVNDPLRLDADLVVVAAGLRPNSELAAQARLELGAASAIRVSPQMTTSHPNIYAAGDCAEVVHLVSGRPAWIPLGSTALKMGRVAGANAAGHRERFGGVVGTSIFRLCGLGIALTGLSAEQARQHGFEPVEVWIEAPERARYFRGRTAAVQLVADKRSARLLGASIIGQDGVAGRINVVAAALAGRMLLPDFVNLDLAYAPPFSTPVDPLLVAAQQLMKSC